MYKPATNGEFSSYMTKFVLKRREWPTPEVIEKDEQQQQ
jgi:hypothetical protein